MSERFKPEDRRNLDELLEIEDRMNGTAEGDFERWKQIDVTPEEELEWERIERHQNKQRRRETP